MPWIFKRYGTIFCLPMGKLHHWIPIEQILTHRQTIAKNAKNTEVRLEVEEDMCIIPRATLS